MALLFARDFTAAEDWARKATRIPNCHYWGFAHRVAALGYLKRSDALAIARNELARVKPDFSCREAEKRLFYLSNADQIAIYVEGLRRAGVPDG